MGWKYNSTAKSAKSALIKAVAKATRDTGKAVIKDARTRAPVKTGALVASLYVVDGTPSNTGGDKNGFSEAKSAAIQANAAVASQIDAEISLSPPEGVLRVAVASAVDYAPKIEGGSYDGDTEKYQGGRPFLAPATNAQESLYEARVEGALRQIEERKKL